MAKKQPVSQETVAEAMKIAKGTARPGQNKEQTKLIAQGIEKGIAEYKKREKAKARERDKERKKAQREQNQPQQLEVPDTSSGVAWLPWSLLGLSWLGFIAYQWLLG